MENYFLEFDGIQNEALKYTIILSQEESLLDNELFMNFLSVSLEKNDFT